MAESVKERQSGIYEATFTDEDGDVPILTDLRLSLYDIETEEFINNRQNQNVLNTNDVTYNSDTGRLVWTFTSGDMAIVNEEAATRWTDGQQFYREPFVERHRAVFELTWDGGHTWVSEDFDVTAEFAIGD